MKLFKTLIVFVSILTICSCSDKDETSADANENFIKAVTITTNDNSYDCVIENNTITVTVPYTVSLNGATATFVYTPSAKIIPDPKTITDWDVERTFRVISYNGDINDYTYVVVKDEIYSKGTIELKNKAEIDAFVSTGTTIIKGDLIIGSDEESSEEVKDISTLNMLKKVEGNIIIRNSYTGGTLTGLDNIVSVGGLLIGSEETPATNATIEMVSMSNLENISGNITINNNGVKIVEFNKITNIEGDLFCSSNNLSAIQLPELLDVNGNFRLYGHKDSSISCVEIPKIEKIGGLFEVCDLGTLLQLSLPHLKEVGSINLKPLPREFSKLSLPCLETVDGDFNIEGVYGDVYTGGMTFATGNTGLVEIEGLQKLSRVTGILSIQNFEELATLPFDALQQVGGFVLYQVHKIESLNLTGIDFIPFDDSNPRLKVDSNTKLQKLTTNEDLSAVNVYVKSVGYSIETNFLKVNDLYYNCLGETDVFPLQEVSGNLSIINPRSNLIDVSKLKSVNGFLLIEASHGWDLKFSSLESVGGQLHIIADEDSELDFSNLEQVCCDNPVYGIEGNMISTGLDYSSFNIRAYTDIEFGKLKKIGGKGITLKNVQRFDCPELESIEGSFQCESPMLTSGKLTLPKLKNLSGVYFNLVKKFNDFTIFAPFINDGQITSENWQVTGCAYNPTYEDMKAGRYKPE